MKDSEHAVVLVTTSSSDEAERIAGVLIDRRSAACVNIVSQVCSKFWWQGKVDSEDESLLIVKTRAELLGDVIGLVRANHSYEVPEVIAIPIVGGNQDYLAWLDDETGRRG